MVRFVGRAGFVVVILLAVVGINSAVGRFATTVQYLADPAAFAAEELPPQLPSNFNTRYYAIPYLTLIHATTGFLFMVLGPLQFVGAIRNRWLNFHRWCGRVFLVASLAGVLTALAFVPMLPVFGSFSSRVGVVVAATYFLVALVQGYWYIRRREIAQHREWMIRLFAVGLGISTFRVFLPLFMIPPFNATFTESWDTVVWLGFIMNAAVAEVWINLTRPKLVPRHVPAAKMSIPGRAREVGSPVTTAD